MKYSLIDQRLLLTEVYSSEDFLSVLHEYLISVSDEVRTLVKHGLRPKFSELDTISSISIVQVEESDKKPHSYIRNQYQMNTDTYQMVHKFGVSDIPTEYPFNTLISYIKKHTSTEKVQNNLVEIKPLVHQSSVRTNPKPVPSSTNVTKSEPDLSITGMIEETKKLVQDFKQPSIDSTKTRFIPDQSEDNEQTSSSEESSEESDSESSEENKTDFNAITAEIDRLESKKELVENRHTMITEEDSVEIAEIERELIKLQEMKEFQEKEMEKFSKDHEKDVANLSKYISKINDEKRWIRKEKEREEERRRVFEADKGVYYRMKQEIREGKRDEDNVPFLFAQKYPIFSFMDEKDLLNDEEDQYELYVGFYEELYPKKPREEEEEEYIPHNINYLTEDEQAKYAKVKKDHSDDIEELLKKSASHKYPSLDDILDKLDKEDGSDESDEGFKAVNFEEE